MLKPDKQYSLSKLDTLKFFAAGILITILLAWIFYRSIAAVFLLMPIAVFYVIKKKKELTARRKQQFNIMFKDMIIAMSAALSSGYSLENSVIESYKEMKLLYGEKSSICVELDRISRKVKLNIPIENLFLELAEKSDIEDVKLFAQIISVAKRTGGNMIGIIRNTADTISRKVETKQEIEILISAKRLEQKIMSVVPIFIISYINITSPEFFDVMYETLMGRLIMTVCMVLYLASCYLSERIVNIEI